MHADARRELKKDAMREAFASFSKTFCGRCSKKSYRTYCLVNLRHVFIPAGGTPYAIHPLLFPAYFFCFPTDSYRPG